MGRSRNKRRSTTKTNGKSKKSKTVNVSSDDESTEENKAISEPESDNTATETSNKKNNVAKNGVDDDDDEAESDADSDDEALINIAKPSKHSKSRPTARHEKSSNAEPAVTDEMIREKELEVAAVLACKKAFGETKFLLKWKDTARGESWLSGRRTLRLCPEAYRKFVADEKKANEIEAIVSRQNYHGDIRYLVKWKDHTKGETWQSEGKIRKFGGRELLKLFRQAELKKPKDEV